MKSKKVYFAQIVLAAAALALVGCGMLKKDEDASVIKTKAVQRWDDLIARKADKAYDFLAPGYRKTISRAQYAKDMNGRGMRWKKVSFGSQTCDVDTCNVHLTVAYNLNLGGLTGKVDSMGLVVETWIKVDGTWYYLPQIASPKLQQGPGK